MNFTGTEEPANIFLSLAHSAEEKIFRRIFPDTYQFDTSSSQISSSHDLGIIDLSHFKEKKSDLQLLKNELAPLLLPIILVAPSKSVKKIVAEEWKIIDDLLCSPVSVEIAKVRVNSLLEQRQKSLNLQIENNLSNKAISSLEVGIVITDPNQEDNPITFCNKGFERMTGYSSEEIKGRNCRFLQNGRQKENEEARQKLRQAISQKRKTTVVLKNFKKDGTYFWNELSIAPIKDQKDENLLFVGIQNDITDLIEAKEKLRSLVQEKDTLLKEVHHRIKNNLAVIAALLELKMFKHENPKLVEMLSDTKNRIFSIAKVHELLYEHDNLHSLRFDRYIENLTSHLEQTYLSAEKNITFELVLQEASLNLNQAVPCGMLLSELVTNAIKHAFNNKRNGQIKIILKKEGNMQSITVKDTGTGMDDEEPQVVEKNSILKTLLKQLNADWQITSDEGMEITFSFKAADYYSGPSNDL